MEIEYGSAFKRQLQRLARRYRHIKDDLSLVINALKKGETPGDQVTGTGHTVFKVRLKNSDNQKGKSGGYRVIYYLKTDTRRSLVTIYSKSDQGDIEPDELRRLLSDIDHQQATE
ncbi:MAG: type II toxin-antitoxin system RelE/ParE family toxin [Spongiibacteraceae bacterium]|nr:type II toxin-antitoxin system RelE/ParE family toxin [Spongiibacteraceae bacterium]